jgi:hypothetical protein
MAFNKALFEEFVASLGLNYFNANELLVGRYQPDNGPPPLTIWHNIVPTILILDHLREYTGCGIKLISAYRTEAYNDPAKNKGRAPKSQHQAFTAIDFRVTGMKPDKVVPILRGWENSEWFWSPIDFQRKPVKISIGTIPFGEMPRKVSAGILGCWFTFRGFVKPYMKQNFTHLDTRGLLPGEDDDGE